MQNINGTLQTVRRLNGDENHQGRHLAIGDESWKVQKVKLYEY